MADKITYTTEEAREQLSIGRSMFFDLLRRGEIQSVKIGRRRVIPAESLHNYLSRVINEQASSGDAA